MKRAPAVVAVAVLFAGLSAMPASADTQADDFENFALGSPNDQHGWKYTRAQNDLDYAIADPSAFPGAPASFGARALRISNALTVSGAWSQHIVSRPLADEVGDLDANRYSTSGVPMSGGTRQPRLLFETDVVSALPSYQHGLAVGLSPHRGDGARMALVVVRDAPDGLAIDTWDYHEPASGCPATEGTGPFRLRTLVTGLSRTSVHRIGMELTANPGAHDDTVVILVDGVRYWGGASWEDYFRCEQTHLPGMGATSRTIDSIGFRVMSGDPLPGGGGMENTNAANDGYGLLFDNLTVSSGPAVSTAPSRFDCSVAQADPEKSIGSVAVLQQAVELLGRNPGNVLELAGACDLTGVAASGAAADGTGLATAGIVIPSWSRDLTLRSVNPSARATFGGNGTQAGIYVAPGAEGTRIENLAFANLAQPIVVHNAPRTTIGVADSGSGTPALLGNRITGGPSMTTGVAALGRIAGASVSVTDGTGDTHASATPPGQRLDDLVVAGNVVSWSAPGVHAIAIGVAQSATGRIDDVSILGNAVGLSAASYPSITMGGVRVTGAAGASPAVTDVTIDRNNLGRLELLGLAPPDSADLQAAGRFGIFVNRAADVTASRNAVRVRVSATPGFTRPGGAIIFGDTDGGAITGNGIIELADSGARAGDLGAIAVIDDLGTLFEQPGAGPPAQNIAVTGNVVGFDTASNGLVGATRGLTLNGTLNVDASGNRFIKIEDVSLIVGGALIGSGATGSEPTLPATAVHGSNLCGNWLNTASTNPAQQDQPRSQVRFASGLGSSGNTFPGGHLFPGNGDC